VSVVSTAPHTLRPLFVSPTAEITGPTRSLRLLLEHLPPGWEPTVLVVGSGEFLDELRGLGVATWRLPDLTRDHVPAAVGRLRGEGWSLVYANETNRATRNACLAAWWAGVPFYTHVRNMGWKHGWAEMGHLSAATGVVAVSHACARSVERFTRAERLHVVHNGVPLPSLEGREDARSALRRMLGVAPETRVVLCLGHLTPRKGQDLAVEAYRESLDPTIATHLCLAGALDRDPGYVEEVRRIAEGVASGGGVSILGFRTDVAELLLGSDVLLHTPRADPHPRAVLEAMATGLPVVAFATDGVAETVAGGATGHLVASGDTRGAALALRSVLACPDVGRGMGLRGRLKAEREFAVERTAERVVALLNGSAGRWPEANRRA
jgi:glycosyltransferase involved in cell wall biosynthesis